MPSMDSAPSPTNTIGLDQDLFIMSSVSGWETPPNPDVHHPCTYFWCFFFLPLGNPTKVGQSYIGEWLWLEQCWGWGVHANGNIDKLDAHAWYYQGPLCNVHNVI